MRAFTDIFITRPVLAVVVNLVIVLVGWRALTARGHRPGIVAFGREHHDRLMERLIPPGGAYLGPRPVTTHELLKRFAPGS